MLFSTVQDSSPFADLSVGFQKVELDPIPELTGNENKHAEKIRLKTRSSFNMITDHGPVKAKLMKEVTLMPKK